MKKSAILLSVIGLTLSSLSFANSNQNQQNHPQQPQKNPAIEKALQECHSTVGTKQQGQKPSQNDMAKIDACMEKKGFKKPQGQPPQGQAPQGQPPKAPHQNQ